MITKLCNKCKCSKALDSFPKISRKQFSLKQSSKDYLDDNPKSYKNSCRDCLAEQAREWRKKNPGYTGSGKLKRIPKNERDAYSAVAFRFNDAKNRAKKRKGQESDIDSDYAYEVYKQQKGKCALTGVTLLLDKNSPLTLSIDQIKAGKGYVKGNIQWLCWAVNRAKGDMEMADFISMCRAIMEKCND